MLDSFNWTKVELKLCDGDHRFQLEDAFNWTKVELKHGTPTSPR